MCHLYNALCVYACTADFRAYMLHDHLLPSGCCKHPDQWGSPARVGHLPCQALANPPRGPPCSSIVSPFNSLGSQTLKNSTSDSFLIFSEWNPFPIWNVPVFMVPMWLRSILVSTSTMAFGHQQRDGEKDERLGPATRPKNLGRANEDDELFQGPPQKPPPCLHLPKIPPQPGCTGSTKGVLCVLSELGVALMAKGISAGWRQSGGELGGCSTAPHPTKKLNSFISHCKLCLPHTPNQPSHVEPFVSASLCECLDSTLRLKSDPRNGRVPFEMRNIWWENQERPFISGENPHIWLVDSWFDLSRVFTTHLINGGLTLPLWIKQWETGQMWIKHSIFSNMVGKAPDNRGILAVCRCKS